MIRLATIGSSAITEKFLSAVKTTERYIHTAVYSRSFETGRAFAEKVGCDTVFTDIEELAKSDIIDAVYIASPNSCHFEQSRIFLEKGKHVICEKPIVTRAEEYTELKRLADSKGLIYMEAIKSIHTASRKAVKETLAKLGNIACARIDFCQLSSRYDSFMNGVKHNIFDMSLHAGTLMDLGVYCVYAAVDFFGVPSSVSATAAYFDNGADKSGYAVLDYGDMQCVLSYSKAGQSAVGSEIVGDKGTLVLESISQYAGVELFKDGKKSTVFGSPDSDAVMSGEAYSFADYIEGKRLDEYSEISELAYQVHCCMDKIKQSAGLHYN